MVLFVFVTCLLPTETFILSLHDALPMVTAGTRAYGNFGGTAVVANKELGIQVIYGHLSRNIPVKIGRKVRQGDTVGYQSNTNYQGVRMNSHLHIQFQNYGYIAGERDFVCS